MKKPTLKKYPKKPKASATLAAQQNYLNKIHAIDTDNLNKINQYKRSKELAKKISGIKQKHTNWDVVKSYTRKPKVKKHQRRVSGVKRKRSKR